MERLIFKHINARYFYRNLAITLLMVIPVIVFAQTRSAQPASVEFPTTIEEAEGWFEVDDIHYHIIEGTNTCEVGDYDLVGPITTGRGRYKGDVVIPEKVTYKGVEYEVVGIHAMDYCRQLRSVKIPSSVRYIEGFTGNGKAFRSLSIPEGVEKISGILGCMALTDLELPATLKEMTDWSVSDLRSLERVVIHGMEPIKVGANTFSNCNQEVCTLIVPEGAVEAYSKAPGWRNFGKITDTPEPSYLTGEEEVVHAGGLDYVITSEDDMKCALVDNHDYDPDYWYFYEGNIRVPWGMTLKYKEYDLNAIVAFRWSNLKSIEIPDYVEYIDGFKSIKGLETLTIPFYATKVKGITHCEGLKEIVLPEFPVDITMAIYGCDDLKRVVVRCPEPYELGKGTFMHCNQENCTLIVPDGSVEAYSAAPGWKNFGQIISESEAGIDDVVIAEIAYTVDVAPGSICIAAADRPVSVIAIDGRAVATVTPNAELTIYLASGIYLVSDGDTARKILIP